jgi:hypothetical protein
MEDLKIKAENCKDCIGWLHHCRSECCKQFGIRMTNKQKIKKYSLIKFKIILLDPSMELYYELHGVKYVDGYLFIRMNYFEWRDNLLIIKNKCKWLDEQGLCIAHPSRVGIDNRPKMCSHLTNETKNDPRIILTPNCLFRYKK